MNCGKPYLPAAIVIWAGCLIEHPFSQDVLLCFAHETVPRLRIK